ncbi:MAG: BamA/TamA family outer membrane protein [Calditrichaeota bacterium]|nr:BamA/TamA family outer membrane protein [Calditrichota bacterium]
MKTVFLFLLALSFTNPFTALGKEPMKGLSFYALPGMSYKSGQGLEYGVRAYIIHYGDGTLHPYKWNLTLHVSKTTTNQANFFLFWDRPEIFGKKTRMDVFAQFKRYLGDDYYGLGNQVGYEPGFAEQTSQNYLADRYYQYHHEWTAILANYQFPVFSELMRGLVGIGFYHNSVTEYAEPNKLIEDSPFGLGGGNTNYLRGGFIYDTRDEETVTTRGTWTDLLVEVATPLLKSDYTYARITLTDRRYFSLLPRIVYAQRIFYETMPGDAPFYEMAILGNSFRRRYGLGGAYSLRGVPRNLFIGKDKFIANLELRCKVTQKTILKQPLTFYLHFFVDAGKVWLKNDRKDLANLHFAHGIGFHVRWKKDVVASLDIGRSAFQDYAIYASFGNLF